MSVTELMRLHDEITRLQGPLCAVPGCPSPWTDKAHIDPSGAGGRPSTYSLENLVGLCHPCHMIFDGQQLQGRQRLLRVLMRSRVQHIRHCGPSVLRDTHRVSA